MITVKGNEYLLRTAFVNLIENNCKFSDNHTSLIQISFSGTKVTITFSDDGIGIKAEDLQQLFTPFTGAATGIILPATESAWPLQNGSLPSIKAKSLYGQSQEKAPVLQPY